MFRSGSSSQALPAPILRQMSAPVPADEAARLAALRAHHLLDTEPEQAFDDLARIASIICGTPMATVTLVDADRQWHKAEIGLGETETPRDEAFCAYTILGSDPMVVSDATHDPRFAQFPNVTGERAIRFYAATPLHSADGYALGTLCVLDRRPRELTQEQADALTALGRQAEHLLEMRRSVKALALTQRALAAGEERLRRILETAGEGYVTINEHGCITAWNAQAETMFGWTRDEVLGMSLVETIIPERFADAHRAGLKRFLDTGEVRVMGAPVELIGRRRDGREIPLEVTIWATKTDGLVEFSAFLREISERRRAEQLVALLQQATAAANEAPGATEALGRCLDTVCAHTGWPVGHAWLRDEAEDVLRSTGRWHLDDPDRFEKFRAVTGKLSFEPSESVLGRDLGTGQAAWITCVLDDDRFRRAEAAAGAGLASGITFPVMIGSEVVAVLEFFTTEPAEPDERLLDVMGQVGIQLGRAVERERAARRERELTERERQLLASTGEGIFAIDLDGNCTFANPAASELLGFERDEILGASPHGLFHHTRPDGTPYPAAECRILRAMLAGRAIRVDDELLWRADGTPLEAEYSAVPIVSDDQVLGAVVTFTDITERRAVERARSMAAEQLERANVELRELDQLRADFVATVSHELRTPLTSIGGYAELLADGEAGPLGDQQQEWVAVIDRNTRRLLTLIEDLLTLSRIEAGRFTSDLRPVELGSLLECTVQAIRPAAAARDLELVADIDDPGLAEADSVQLDRVLLNLLSNAVKFTPVGGRVEVTARQKDGAAVIAVTDTGIGIPLEEQPRLFTRFFRSSTATEKAIQGTGLGLVIVKNIIDQHGGEITVESVPGEGTTVEVTLPLITSTT
jgi:PAS domain S-box-containing protein